MMEQKDYKAIGQLIKRNLYNLVVPIGYTKDDMNLINELADYFEKEDKKYSQGFVGNLKNGKIVGMMKTGFDKKQFLEEWCGVGK